MEKVVAEGGRRGGPGRGNNKCQAPGWHFWGDSLWARDGREWAGREEEVRPERTGSKAGGP